MGDLAGKVLDGKYELVGLLGEGGMGEVYEAKHLLIGRRLAVKFLHSQYVSSEEVVTRFQREAQAAAAIGHENIIEVTDMGTTPEGAPYIVMEYLDGMDVKDLIAEQGTLSPERAANIMVQALSALQAAHTAKIIHRDLKPENIYLIQKTDQPDYVKILDFGISKFKALEGDDAKGLTQTGTVLGTPYYMSPEQARGDQDLSARSDVYAMGVILYQMMAGCLPFDAPNYNALLIKILTEEPVDATEHNPEIPPELAEAINVSMARDPNDRYQDCIEFRRHLLPFVPGASTRFETGLSPASRTAVNAALSATATETPLEMTRSGLDTPSKGKLPLIIGGVAAVLVAVIVGFFFLKGDKKEAPAPATVQQVAPKPLPPPPQEKKEPKAASPAKETKPNSVNLTILSVPSSAEIKIDGVVVDSNPFKGPFTKDKVLHRIEIVAQGYETTSAFVRFDRDQKFSYTLKKKSSSSSRSRRKKAKDRDRKKREVKPDPPKADPPTRVKRKPRRKIDDEDPWG